MEVFYGAVEISGSRCGVEGCDAEPVAVQPIRTSEETGVWCLGREHTDELQAVPDDLPTAFRLINPTCAYGGAHGDAPCGAVSTHVAIVGIKDHGLDVTSVCARHVEFFATGR